MDRTIRWLRLVTGLILLVFVTTHLLNTALALHHLSTAEAARPYMMAVWYHPIGLGLLTLSAIVHMGLGLLSLYRRRSLKMPLREALQLATGLLIPPLLAGHVIGTRGALQAVGLDVDYVMMMTILWGEAPLLGLKQVIVTVVAWEHAKIGLYGWLNLRPWWPRVALPANVIAVAVPVLALLGFVEGGKEAPAMLADPAAAEQLQAKLALAGSFVDTAIRIESQVVWGWILLVSAVLVARLLRDRLEARGAAFVVHTDGPSVRGRVGQTLLEVSRAGDVAHAAACGGRGRCGTCRVALIAGADTLNAPGEIERQVLAALDADPATRLACQARIAHPGTVRLTRLLPAYADAESAVTRHRASGARATTGAATPDRGTPA